MFIAANIHAVTRARLADRRHQRLAPLRDVVDDRGGLEQHQVTFFIGRNLPERLQTAVGLGALILGPITRLT